MNKKMKAALVLTLVVQLLIPVYLLSYHYTVTDTALNSSREYRFRITTLEFDIPDDVNADFECDSIYFKVADIEKRSGEKIEVTSNEYGFAKVSERENGSQTDNWFDYKQYKQYRKLNKNDFTFNSDIAVRYTMNEMRKAYAWYNKNDENREYAYVTAKVYKGRFIPTAIYFNGIKVLTINNS